MKFKKFRESRVDLISPAFKRNMLAELEQREILDSFRGLVAHVVARVNDGKEATVYLCAAESASASAFEARSESDAGLPLLAAKMYRARKFRAFRSDASYAGGRPMRDRRMAKAMRQRTRTGAVENQLQWVDHEWQMLNLLFDAGVGVPRPIAHCDAGILMEYLGDEHAAAPMLSELHLDSEAAADVWKQLQKDLATMLSCGVVHGDLSAYNVLLLNGRPRVIDLPQSLHADAPNAFACWERDVTNIAGYFARAGLNIDVPSVVIDLWQKHWR